MLLYSSSRVVSVAEMFFVSFSGSSSHGNVASTGMTTTLAERLVESIP